MPPLWIVRRQFSQLRERVEHDEALERRKGGELRLFQYELELIERMLAHLDSGDRAFWEMEQAIVKGQCEQTRQELHRLQIRLARNRELLGAVERDLESRYR